MPRVNYGGPWRDAGENERISRDDPFLLTLGGTGTGTNTFAGNLVDLGGANTLIISKIGSGTWILGGTNILNQVNTFTPDGGNYSTVVEGTLLATQFASLPGVADDGWFAEAGATLAVRAGGGGEWTGANLDVLLGDGGNTWAFDTGSKLGIEVTGANNFTYGNDIAGTSYAPAESASKGLVKLGTGTPTLTGTSTYTGATAVNVGTLVAANAAALGTTAAETVVDSGATLDVRANIGLEELTIGGAGVGGNGALITSATFTGTVGGAVVLTANTSLGGDGTLNVNGAVTGGFNVTKVGAGPTIFAVGSLAGVGNLTTSAGTTNVSSVIGTGTSSVTANATTNFYVSQTLASLTIGDGVEVTFGDGLPFAGGGGNSAHRPSFPSRAPSACCSSACSACSTAAVMRKPKIFPGLIGAGP